MNMEFPKHYDVRIRDGVEYYSVTSVMQIIHDEAFHRLRGLKGNFDMDNIMDRAGYIGNVVDDYFTKILLLKPYDYKDQPVEIYSRVSALEKWVFENVDHVNAVQKRYFSRKNGCCGTIDALLTLRGRKRPDLVDLKTGKLDLPKWGIQTGTYKDTMKESGEVVNRRLILHSVEGKNPNLIELPAEDFAGDLIAWKYAKFLFLKYWKGSLERITEKAA